MLRFLWNKIKNKLWINICLLLGIVFFIGMVALNPVYQEAALQKMLQSDFENLMESTGQYPAVAQVEVNYSSDTGFSNDEFESLDDINTKITSAMKVDTKDSVILRRSGFILAVPDVARDNDEKVKKLRISSMTNLPEHAKILAGENLPEGMGEDGTYPCIVSMKTLTNKKMVMGDVFSFKDFTDSNGKAIRLKVVGVFDREAGDTYFVNAPDSYVENLFISEECFKQILSNCKIKEMTMNAVSFSFLDYAGMNYANAESYAATIAAYEKKYQDKTKINSEFNFTEMLDSYRSSEGKVKMIIWILQIPVLVLLLVFIFTVSGQILELEEGEISMLKSRGVKRRQLIFMYFEQASMLSVVGILIGIPFALFLCKVVGAANSFMEFVSRRNLTVRLDLTVLLYALAAALVASAFMTLPVIRYSKTGIVEQKRKSTKKKIGAGGELVIGALILLMSVYEWKNFTNQQELLAQNVAKGNSVDPILFFSSSLFILGAAIVLTLLMHFAVKLIFRLFQKKMNPALFASYLQILRSGGKQFVISIFLIITIAMGIYNSNMARTINDNEEEGIRYVTGADVILQETWKDNHGAVVFNPATQLKYTEPDFGKYQEIVNQSESVTKVLRDDNVDLLLDKKNAATGVTMLGINTKEFGETAWMRGTLMKAHWYEYLNLISQNPSAVLISKNMSEDFDLEVGDKLTYTRTNYMKQNMGYAEAVVYGIVDYFPTYNSSNKNYLIVANYSQVCNRFDMNPYEIWIKTNGSTDYIYDVIDKQNIPLTKLMDVDKSIVTVKNDPIFQATNGLLTISFIMILVLCIVGFLIYWILTIHSRELVYGIFRAMGVSMKEIVTMLVNEQIYCSVLSLIFGTVIGIAASRLYIPLVEISYSSFAHMLPIRVVNRISDIVQVGVITGGMVLVGIFILGWILKKLNITQALKLGED